ncbi:EpsG family protein [Bacillus cereus]|uniref:EpsG family protein n=1 Tax=unclassified Bacillus (in: firmicutes) TaxID=185979 RepID=UPI00047E3754|nr:MULTISPECIES: EpsG family protein [unclassified Bacillus (in: firmicutes)]PFE04370.1 EpsG family protein [Bacillus sp. AFS023182]PGY05054.1 EpsG family protein [Bacillus cereus]SDZ34132.1 EpsG family protein [Bacillus sp. 166amftsu]
MTILWINLFVVYILSFFARYSAKSMSNGIVPVQPNKMLSFLAMASLVIVSGLRNNIGDTYFYMYSYAHNEFSWSNIDFSGDFGFDILQMFLQHFSKDPQIMIFFVALVTNVLIVITLYKYSRMFELALFVYITGGMYLVSMNGIRQFLAASIVFLATKYIFNGNWKKYILIVLLAAMIHKSALILIPIYFLVRRKAWAWDTYVLLFFSVIIVIGFNQFSSALFSALESTQYGHYKNFAEGGANVLRVAVSAVPIVIAYLGREKLREVFPKSDYIVNMSLIGLVFMIISTQNWIFARFTIYFSLYQLILISWIVVLFSKKDRKFVYYGLLLCYLIYYFYENVISLGIIYTSKYISL